MGREEPLRISCDDRLGADPASPTADLDPDLQAAFDTLTTHGLHPQVVAHRRRNGAARAS
jgi:hypothetical protein